MWISLDAALAECLGLQTQILYYMVRLHHHKGDEAQVSSLSTRLGQVETIWTRSDASQDEVCMSEVRQILDIVVSVAGYVASGEAAERLLRSASTD